VKVQRSWYGGAALALALLAATAAYVVALPTPWRTLALFAIVLGEKSWLLLVAALLALLLASRERGSGRKSLGALTLLCALPAASVALWPIISAYRLAHARSVTLSLGRYLASQVDSEGPGKPDFSQPYARVDGQTLRLDVYGATTDARPRPALVIVHGGGWSGGSRGDATLVSRRFAALGFTVFDLDYRLRQPNFRTAVGDVKCAIGYLKTHAREKAWHIDPTKLTLLGRSAGGHLALLSAYSAGDSELTPSCDVPDTGVSGVVALYPLVDLTWGYAHPEHPGVFDTRARIEGFVGAPPELASALYRALSPNLRATAGAPPTLLVHGELDQFVSDEHSRQQARALERLHVPHDSLYLPYGQHCFDFVVGGFSEQLLEAAVVHLVERGAP
jgi:acetyl esterase/lipase